MPPSKLASAGPDENVMLALLPSTKYRKWELIPSRNPGSTEEPGLPLAWAIRNLEFKRVWSGAPFISLPLADTTRHQARGLILA